MGGRSYPVRHYPVAIRLRDRKGRAILCLRLSSKWGLVGRCTRSAFRRTPSHKNTLICLVGVTLPATPAVRKQKSIAFSIQKSAALQKQFITKNLVY